MEVSATHSYLGSEVSKTERSLHGGVREDREEGREEEELLKTRRLDFQNSNSRFYSFRVV